MKPQHPEWKTAFRSFYYAGAPQPEDPVLLKGKVALLVIDVQNVYITRPDPPSLDDSARKTYDAWAPFHERMQTLVLPKARDLTPTRKRGEARHPWQTTFKTVAAPASTINQSSILPKAPIEFHPGKLYPNHYQESSRPNKRNMFLQVE
jgi:hypothetical protein